MSLLVKDERIDVKVCYKKNAKNKLEFADPDKDLGEEESNYTREAFTFIRPGWGQLKTIFSESITVSPDGEWKVDPWKYMDAKVRHLLVDWTLKEEDDNKVLRKVPVTRANINRLEFELVSYLNKEIDLQFGETTSLT